MKLRNFLQVDWSKKGESVQEYSISQKGLSLYLGQFDSKKAAHLLSRTLHGFSKDQLDKAIEIGLDKTIELLLTDGQEIEAPLNVSAIDTSVEQGKTWVNQPYNVLFENARRQSLYGWLFGQTYRQSISLVEQMTLFLHNHFAIEFTQVPDSRYNYRYYKLLRDNSLGNFKNLVGMITIDQSMLVYLNGNRSTFRAPNENYARELFELFTIGKGPQVGEGDYTYYTEHDILEAAKVLTGWRDQRFSLDFKANFNRLLHDSSSKVFSSRFESQLIDNNGESEYLDLINMIFAKKQTAINIIKELYLWFISDRIEEVTYNNFIIPLADKFIESGFELKPILRILFKSEHFFDDVNIGVKIKNPIDFLSGIIKNLEVKYPESNPIEEHKFNFDMGWGLAFNMDMGLGQPPGVAGWSAYYQSPLYYRSWVNSVTMTYRMQISDALANANGIRIKGLKISLEPLILCQKLENPQEPNMLIDSLAKFLFRVELSKEQIADLKPFLLPNEYQDYVWTQAWLSYKQDLSNETLKNTIENQLFILIRKMLSLAEYQLK